MAGRSQPEGDLDKELSRQRKISRFEEFLTLKKLESMWLQDREQGKGDRRGGDRRQQEPTVYKLGG